MASTKPPRQRHVVASEVAMAGVLALLVEEREERIRGDGSATKTEVVLANAGLSYDDIAAVTGKKPDAVRMAVTRKKAK